jgi:site-specific recombinase XerD
LRLHDLRRTVGSWLSQDGVDLNRVRDALRHANISTTLTYAKLGEDPVREAMERHGQRILEAAGKRGPVAVVGGNGEK